MERHFAASAGSVASTGTNSAGYPDTPLTDTLRDDWPADESRPASSGVSLIPTPNASYHGYYYWIGGNGSFSNGGAWRNNKQHVGTVPGAKDFAAIQTSASISGNGTVKQLNIEDSYTTVQFTGSITTHGLFVDDQVTLEVSTSTGTLSVSAGFTVNPGATLIATDDGTIKAGHILFEGGPLVVTSGGHVSCSGYIEGNGVVVDGSGSTVTSNGFDATSLSLGDGASIVDHGAAAIDTSVTIFGTAKLSAASDLSLSSGTLSTDANVSTSGALYDYVTGTNLTVESGARLSAGSAFFNNTTTVIGKGSSLSVKGLAEIGDYATEIVAIEAGAHMQAGTITVGSGTIQNLLEVTGAGSGITVTDELDAGLIGAASVLVAADAGVTVGSLVAGDYGSSPTIKSDGTITVTGTGSRMVVKGISDFGLTGFGGLTVSGGGSVTADGIWQAGVDQSGTSTDLVTGLHSSLRYATDLIVGGAGEASLGILAGGIVAAGTSGSGTIELGTGTTGNGSITVAGTGSALGAATLAVGGSATASGGTGALTIETGGRVTVTALQIWGHGTVDFAGGVLAAKTISIAAGGLLEKTSAAGTSGINEIVNDAGNILVGAGALDFTGTATSIAGTVSGAGTLQFGAGQITLAAGAVLSVAHLTLSGATVTLAKNLTYNGSFTQTAGPIKVSGYTLVLNGADTLTNGAISGAGFLATYGTVSLANYTINAGAVWQVCGKTIAAGSITLGNGGGGSGRLAVESGGSYDITANGGIVVAPGGSGTVGNFGLFEKTGGTGISTVRAAFTNSGTLAVSSGALDLAGAVTGTGSATIDSTGVLRFDSTVAATQTIAFAGTTGGRLALNDPAGTGLGFAGIVKGFGGQDQLDLTTFAFSGKPAIGWSQTSASGGILTVTDGSKIAKITLFGQYSQAGFGRTQDGGSGTDITYAAPPQLAALAPSHR